MLAIAGGHPSAALTEADLRNALFEALARLEPRRRVLVVPPDYTRRHSFAGLLTRLAFEYYGDRLTDVLPAIGTHSPMTDRQLQEMFGPVPLDRFRIHDWRRGTETVGEVPADFVRKVTQGRVNMPWPAQLDRLALYGGYDLILSVGQVVPHEVVGMASYTKNLFVGIGGEEAINRSHFIGAVYGMERMMGRADTPVRRILDNAAERFIAHLPVVYVHTVVRCHADGTLAVCGLFIGDGREVFTRAAELSAKVNVTLLDEPLRKVVVWLPPEEYQSTWLGNKSIYRTRMAIADGGELVVLAPGVKEFGEDPEIDRLIRTYGYRGTPGVLALVEQHEDLRRNLSAAAHLIHGSTEDRFRVVYAPGRLSRSDIEAVHFEYGDLDRLLSRYAPERLRNGWNRLADGEEVFFISNPGLGLWAHRTRFESAQAPKDGAGTPPGT